MVPASGFLLSRYCHDCAKSDVKQYSYYGYAAGGETYSVFFTKKLDSSSYVPPLTERWGHVALPLSAQFEN